MKSGSMIRDMFLLYQALIVVTLAGLVLPGDVFAVQWKNVAQTGRHQVALEMQSLRLNDAGRLTVWLRFIPRGETERREAAREYNNKNYRMHLEYYEIDCGEKSAVLNLLDILGNDGKRLARLPGGGPPDAIIPGTVLDRAYLQACPSMDEATGDDDKDTPEAPDSSLQSSEDDSQIPEEIRQRIDNAMIRTKKDPADFGSWVELGNAYFDADLPRKAVDAYDQALKLKADDPNVLNDQGAMYRQTGDFNRALKNFEKSLSIDPGNLESLYNMGYVYAIDLNRIGKGLEIWKRYLQLDSTSDIAQQVRSFVKHFEKSQDVR